MTMAEAVRSFFRRYTEFSGRSRRSEYWWVSLALTLAYLALSIVGAVLSALSESMLAVVGLIFVLGFLGVIIPSIAVSVRRLHDVGRTGWWVLLSLVPFGSIVLIVFACLDSEPGTNRWGAPPKAVTAY